MVGTFDKINATLNELVLQVFSGVDYVSKISLETSKSIPVVHRQLEELVKANILTRTRQGKRVTYGVNWSCIADVINSIVLLDISDVPGAKQLSKDQMVLATKEFLAHPHTQELMRAFFSSQKAKTGATGRAFKESMRQFLDVFGMLSQEERDRFAKKINASAEVRAFLEHCANQYVQRQRRDPRFVLVERIKNEL
ncbi:TPA: hypothetical protein HA251_01325 [Candidatus Woesearchaeota archaeon]|nr:hypothetical protein [Candidatus Woesearchaeota archaeon]